MLGWDRFTHSSEKLYNFRRGIMSRLHRAVMSLSGDVGRSFTAFEDDVCKETVVAVQGLSVIETGCGPGWESNRLLTEFGARLVVATDFSLGMLQDAKRNYPQLLCVQVDARNLPFRDGCVDVVYSNCMYHHIPVEDRQKVLTESLRVARKSVLLKDIAGFRNPGLNLLYRIYYSIVDGSAYRFTAEKWEQFLSPWIRTSLRSPEKSLIFRYVFYLLDASRY